MKISIPPIAGFITDFKLIRNDGIINFYALIKFIAEHKQIELKTEVQIVSIVAKEKDVIYLLNPVMTDHQIPDMLDSDTVIVYEAECLSVNGYSAIHGHYSIKIYPITSWENAY